MIRRVRSEPKKVLPIEDYLKEQNKILDEVGRVLKDEFTTIKARNVPQLQNLVERKSALMVKLRQNDQRIKVHPEVERLREDLKDRVGEIKAKLVTCKRQNETNGRFISICMASTRRLSAMLMGARDQATRNMTYDDKGSASATGPERLSVQA